MAESRPPSPAPEAMPRRGAVPPALCGFLLLLALAFCGAYAIGRAAGPVGPGMRAETGPGARHAAGDGPGHGRGTGHGHGHRGGGAVEGGGTPVTTRGHGGS